jgi:hypothetical protein
LLSFGAESSVFHSSSKNIKIKIYRTIILPAVLYGCETWSLTLREERRLRVSENMVLKRIFGLKRGDVMEEWRRLYNEELYDVCSSPSYYLADQIEKNMKGEAYVARVGDKRGAYTVLVGKPKGRRPLGRHMPIWDDNIQMNLQEVGWGGMDWIDLAKDRDRRRVLVNTIMNLQVPKKCGEFLD